MVFPIKPAEPISEVDTSVEMVKPLEIIEPAIESIETVEKSVVASLSIKLFVQDESRFGLMTVLRRRITLKGVKPKAQYQHDFDNTWLYGAVAPLTGDSFFLELPILNTQCFQIFIDQFSQTFFDTLNIITLDNGSFHTTPKLVLPANVRFVFTPPCTPEVNPMERVWLDFKAQIAGEIFATIDTLFDRLASIIRACLPSQFSSLTSYPFFKAVCNALL